MRMALQQKQMLKMVMTTELRQAIELLQLSTYELLQFIQDQAEDNPFIELVEKSDYRNEYDTRPRRTSFGNEVDPIDFAAKHEKSMHEFLLEQIVWLYLDEPLYELVHYLILNINEQGYLAVTKDEVYEQLDVTETLFENAKKVLQQLEPEGIGASNVAECLSIQARAKYPDDELLFTVIENHLQLIADKQWNKISKELNVSLEIVNEKVEQIQTLHPRPATSLSNTKIDYVSPDIFIDKNKTEHSYSIQLNDHYVPRVVFNNNYSTEIVHTKEISQYVSNHFKKYEWLQKSIEQRRNTILKIMKVIITRQQDFLQNGLRSLKPLTLKDVADEIEMHESTVSRATANKIVQTPVGTFELRHLFSTKLSTKSGVNMSQTKVKTIIQEMIESEDIYKPLSDQKIADQLKVNKGIVISRRTVAKYRDELRIPSSSKRKELKICAD